MPMGGEDTLEKYSKKAKENCDLKFQTSKRKLKAIKFA